MTLFPPWRDESLFDNVVHQKVRKLVQARKEKTEMMWMGVSIHGLLVSILTLIWGVLILVYPRLLSYLIGIYLCLIGVWGILRFFLVGGRHF